MINRPVCWVKVASWTSVLKAQTYGVLIRASPMVGTLRGVSILTHNSKYYFLYSHSSKSFLAPLFQNTLQWLALQNANFINRDNILCIIGTTNLYFMYYWDYKRSWHPTLWVANFWHPKANSLGTPIALQHLQWGC